MKTNQRPINNQSMKTKKTSMSILPDNTATKQAQNHKSAFNTQYEQILDHFLKLGYKVGEQVCGVCVEYGKFAGKSWVAILGETDFKEFWQAYNAKKALKDGYLPKNPHYLNDEQSHYLVEKDGLEWLNSLNNQGYNVFFHVNGCLINNHCETVKAYFFESDDKTKEEQWKTIKNWNFKPSLVVDTGNKSLHVYFLVDETEKEDFEVWKKIQTGLIDSNKSDKSIKDLARNLRLASFKHPKTGNIVEIKEYNEENFMSTELVKEFNIEEKENNKNNTKKDINCNQETDKKSNQKYKTNSKKKKIKVKVSNTQLKNKKWMEKAIHTILADIRDQTGQRKPKDGMEGKVTNLYDERIDILTALIDYYGENHDQIEELMEMYFPEEEAWREKLESLVNANYSEPKSTIHKLFYYADVYDIELPDFEFDENYVPNTTTIDNFIFETIFENNYFVKDDTFYEYIETKGYWKKRKESQIKKTIAKKLRKVYTTKGENIVFCFANNKTVNSCFNFAKSALSLDYEPSNKHLMAYNNGTVNLKTGELENPSKDNYLTQLIPYDYVEKSEIPSTFNDFLLTSYGEEQIEIIRAAISMLIDPTAPFGKFIHIIGKSGTGKGTLVRLLQKMVGLENTMSLEGFGILSNPDKRHQHLTNISLCIAPDASGFQQNLQAFYELVDNGAMAGRGLHSNDGYQKQWFIRFIMASVQTLPIENSGEGWKRRCIPITTKNHQSKENPNLQTELEQEIGEILGWALSMDKERRDQILLSSDLWSESAKALQNQQQVNGDSVASFIDSCLEPTENENDVITKNTLYDYYKLYCAVTGYKPNNVNNFFIRIESLVNRYCIDAQTLKVNHKNKKFPKRMINTKIIPQAFKEEEWGKSCNVEGLSEGKLIDFLEATKKGSSGGSTGSGSQKADIEGDSTATTSNNETGSTGSGSSAKNNPSNPATTATTSNNTATTSLVASKTPQNKGIQDTATTATTATTPSGSDSQKENLIKSIKGYIAILVTQHGHSKTDYIDVSELDNKGMDELEDICKDLARKYDELEPQNPDDDIF